MQNSRDSARRIVDRFAPVCPDFVMELRSKSDDVTDLMAKMMGWIENGARQAWLIDPYTETCYQYRDGNVDNIEAFDRKLKAQGPLGSFELHLSVLREI